MDWGLSSHSLRPWLAGQVWDLCPRWNCMWVIKQLMHAIELTCTSKTAGSKWDGSTEGYLPLSSPVWWCGPHRSGQSSCTSSSRRTCHLQKGHNRSKKSLATEFVGISCWPTNVVTRVTNCGGISKPFPPSSVIELLWAKIVQWLSAVEVLFLEDSNDCFIQKQLLKIYPSCLNGNNIGWHYIEKGLWCSPMKHHTSTCSLQAEWFVFCHPSHQSDCGHSWM